MLYNKNNVRKTNDKKILHKVGKQWKVVSVALLMAIGGGAAVAATNNNANAQSTNGASVNVQSEAADLENDNYAAPKSASATSSKASSASAKAPSLANVNYAPSARVDGNNASAASYHNQDEFDKAEINFYGPTVKSYVNSINAKYPVAAHNLQSNYSAASMSASNDASLATSYSGVAKNSANSSIVSNLAARTGLTTSAFVDTVKYNASNYANAVKSASAGTYAMSLAYSLVNEASGMAGNLPELATQAQVSSAVASANFNTAYSLANVAQSVADAAVSASSINASNLTSAIVQSISASGSAQIALDNSGADASNVNSFAQSNSMVKSGTSEVLASNWNSSAVSSAVSAAANQFANTRSENDVTVSYSDFSGRYNFKAVSDAYSEYASNDATARSNGSNFLSSAAHSAEIAMYQVVSDTSNMSSAASARAKDASVIASANASKAYYASNVAATALSAKNAANNINSLSVKNDAASVASRVLSDVSAGVKNQGSASYAGSLLNALANGESLRTVFGLQGDANLVGAKELAEASGVDVNSILGDKGAIKSMASGIRNGYNTAMASAKGNNDAVTKASAVSSAMNSVAVAADTAYTNTVSASNSYANATDENVTLAGYYASSYSNDAKSEATVASNAAKDLDNFYLANADATFASADAAFNAAKKAEPNDHTLAHAFGVNVLHNSPQFITLTANAMLHSAANYTAKNGVKAVKAGESFAVKGVAFDEAGNIRYVVGESDNNPVYLTGNDAYVENTYLEPDNQYTVKFTKDANAHKGLNFNSKVVGSVKAGQTVTANAVATVNLNSYDHYYGVARLQLANGSYVTANKSYFTVVNNNSNNNNDNSESNKANNNFARDLVLFK